MNKGLMWMTSIWLGIFCGMMLHADFMLVQDGVPKAVIVLGTKPTRSAQLGAYELQYHVKWMTGAELPIAVQPPARGNYIRIGGSNEKLEGESNRIAFSGRELLLTGGDSPDYTKVDYARSATFPPIDYHRKGSLFAVYDFLEIYCGFRFYFFDDSGTTFKPRKTLAVTEKNRDFSPTFKAHRLIHISSDEEFHRIFHFTPRQLMLWRLRWRLSNFYGMANHNQYSLWFKYWGKAVNPHLAKAFVKKRPELFAQGYKGKSIGADPILMRNFPRDRDLPAQFCYTNPDNIEHFAQEAVTYLHGGNVRGGWGNFSGSLPTDRAALPKVEGMPYYYPLEGGDNAAYCKCPACRRLQKGMQGNDHAWNHSNMKFEFISKVARRAAELDPQAGIATLAYITNLSYPDKVKLADNIAVGLCLTNYTWFHPTARKKQLAEYRKWIDNEKGRRPLVMWTYIFSSFWDAYIHFGKYKPFPGLYPWKIGEQFKMFGRDGITGWFTCIQLQFNHLEGYLAARLCYDNSLDPNVLIDEYFDAYYGKAGSAMKNFYREIESIFWNAENYPKAWRDSKEVVLGPYGPKHPFWVTGLHSPEVNWALGTDERMARLNQYIIQAKKLVETPAEKKRLSRIVNLIWNPALEGKREFVQLQNLKKGIFKSVIAEAVPPAQGKPEAIDWQKLPVLKKWGSIYGKDIGSGCWAQMASDDKFFYVRMGDDKAGEDRDVHLWEDNFEVFFCCDGKYPVLQVAVGRNSTVQQYHYFIQNDVNKRVDCRKAVNISSSAKAGKFLVMLAVPLSELPMGKIMRMNMMRTNTAVGSQVWSPTFTQRYIDTMPNAGFVYRMPMTVKAEDFTCTDRAHTGLEKDTQASTGQAAWQTGLKGWRLRWNVPDTFPTGKYRVSAWLRSDTPREIEDSHRLGFYNTKNKKSQVTRMILVKELSGKTYKEFNLGTFQISPGQYFFLAALRNNSLKGENRLWVDRLVLKPVK